MKNTAQGVCRETNTAQGDAECCICLETPPRVLYFQTDKQGGASIDILYFWLDARFFIELTTELVS